MKILVRNLNRKFNKDELLALFKPFGEIESHTIVMDQKSGQSKGFGFVEMPVDAEAEKAIHQLNGKMILGMKVRVKRA